MNINVGLGSAAGVDGGEAMSDSGPRSSSPLGTYVNANGITRAPSRSSNYDSAPQSREPVGVSSGFLAASAMVSSAASSTLASSMGGDQAWGGQGEGQEKGLGVLGGRVLDHAFTGATLQRSSSAPPMSDHSEAWTRPVLAGRTALPPPAEGAATDSDYYYYYYANHNMNPRIPPAGRGLGQGGATSLAVSRAMAVSVSTVILESDSIVEVTSFAMFVHLGLGFPRGFY
ncbi:unnamed protein product [Choristocarpus tenellus]